jgi:type I restriction enzyme S subunit
MIDWVEKPLDQLATIRVSNVDKKTYASESEVRLCNYMNVYTRRYLNGHIDYMQASATAQEISRFSLERGDVLITKDSESPDDIGIAALIEDTDGLLVCGYHLAILRPDKAAVDPLFLLKQIGTHSVQRYYSQRAAGSTRYALSIGTISSTPIRVAPREQQAIVGRVLRVLDKQLETTEALIAKQERVRAGLLQDLFTRGVDEHGVLRPPREEAPQLYQQTEFGPLPTAWSLDKLTELTSKIVDGVHHTPSYVTQGVPFVTVRSLTSGRSIDTEGGNFISYLDHKIFVLRADPKAGDVLVSKDGTLGIARYVDENIDEFSIFVSVAMLRPVPSLLNGRYLCEFFASKYYDLQMVYLSAGTGLKHIHLEHFRKFYIPRPKLAEQERIVAILTAIDHRISEAESALAKAVRLKSALMQDLLTGRVSVARLLKSEPA